MRCIVIAEYHVKPAEGINVVSKTLIEDLRVKGHDVQIIEPNKVLSQLAKIIAWRADMIVFTHGPGVRTVLASRILRLFSRSRITWIATRPDLAKTPGWLKGKRTAHAVISNRAREDLKAVAKNARIVQQVIGIAPERMQASDPTPLWQDLRRPGVPIAVHVGHLRRNRGLEQMIAIKEILGERIDIVVQASPYFEPAPGLSEELAAAGVHVVREFVPEIARVYRSADLYIFPAPPDLEGAIELPLSVLEAMACQTPVIATKFGALPDVLAGEEGVSFAESTDLARWVADWVDTPPEQRTHPVGLPDRLNAHRIADRIEEIARY